MVKKGVIEGVDIVAQEQKKSVPILSAKYVRCLYVLSPVGSNFIKLMSNKIFKIFKHINEKKPRTKNKKIF